MGGGVKKKTARDEMDNNTTEKEWKVIIRDLVIRGWTKIGFKKFRLGNSQIELFNLDRSVCVCTCTQNAERLVNIYRGNDHLNMGSRNYHEELVASGRVGENDTIV